MYRQLDIFRRTAVWNLAHWCSGSHLPSIFLLFVKAREAWLALKQLTRRLLAHVTCWSLSNYPTNYHSEYDTLIPPTSFLTCNLCGIHFNNILPAPCTPSTICVREMLRRMFSHSIPRSVHDLPNLITLNAVAVCWVLTKLSRILTINPTCCFACE